MIMDKKQLTEQEIRNRYITPAIVKADWRVDIHYKFIGYVEMKEMFGLPMVMAMAKDVEIDDALIAEARGLAKELVG